MKLVYDLLRTLVKIADRQSRGWFYSICSVADLWMRVSAADSINVESMLNNNMTASGFYAGT